MNRAHTLLDEVAAEASRLPLEEVPEVLGRVAALDAALRLRLYSAAGPRPPVPEEPDRLIGVKEAATVLGMTADWVYRHRHELPRVEPAGRSLRFSSARLQKFIKRRAT